MMYKQLQIIFQSHPYNRGSQTDETDSQERLKTVSNGCHKMACHPESMALDGTSRGMYGSLAILSHAEYYLAQLL
jgi:hypothetical protein